MSLTHLIEPAITIPADAHVLVAVMRDEAPRLPYFINYYRRQGFDAFIFIDNDSTDGTRELLLAQPDAYIFGTSEDFSRSGCGQTWTNAILDRLRVDHRQSAADEVAARSTAHSQ